MRIYKYRLYPSKKQEQKFLYNFEICKNVYNELLSLSIKTYEGNGRTLRSFDFNKVLKGKYKGVHSQVLQNVSNRVHKAFQNFFRRIREQKSGKKIKAGFPRFKSRIKSITYPQSGFKFVSGNKLYASKIGSVPLVLHRVPKGVIKTLTIKRNKAGQWFSCFSCEEKIRVAKHSSKQKVGIDIGLENFATLSNGEIIKNPRYLVESESRLKSLHRRVSKRKKGSANRRKAIHKLSKHHVKVSNQRNDFLHKLSRNITLRFSPVMVEDLNIRGMLHDHYLAKSIADASWNTFINMLSYKAVTSGGQLIKVNPRGTSKRCSNCGNVVEMPLSCRKFRCSSCGFICHRDFNAAVNILNGTAGRVGTYTPVGHRVRPHNEAVMSEAGTKRLEIKAGNSQI